MRGVGLHEDSPADGFALDNARREQLLAEVKELGATILRAHYPLHPYLRGAGRPQGILLSGPRSRSTRSRRSTSSADRAQAGGQGAARRTSTPTRTTRRSWSGRSATSSPRSRARSRTPTSAARRASPRAGPDAAGRPRGRGLPVGSAARPSYAPLDVLGINDYFGWYPGPSGEISDRTKLADYLDARARLLSEQGAHGHRVRRRGQPRRPGRGEGHVRRSSRTSSTTTSACSPPSRGSAARSTGRCKEFRVRPGWDGGNPRPDAAAAPEGPARFADGPKKPRGST